MTPVPLDLSNNIETDAKIWDETGRFRWGRSHRVMTDPSIPRCEGIEDARGWPCLALWCSLPQTDPVPTVANASPPEGGIPLSPAGTSPNSFRSLPFFPIWPGFAINTLTYAVLWCVALSLARLRLTARSRRGQCRTCGYDLAGLPTDRCPECGAATRALKR
jgi:hypothetical protein